MSAAEAVGQMDLSLTQKIAQQFRESDTVLALSKATDWLNTISTTPSSAIEQRFENLDLLDGATRKHQKQISDDYLALTQTNRKQEKLLWDTAQGYWVALSNAYLGCITQVMTQSTGLGKFKNRLPVLAARSTRAVAMQIKWVSHRFGLVDSSVWGRLALCQRFAESYNIDSRVVTLYLSNQTKTSVNQEFLRALMLSVSSTDSLSVMEQEIADRWIEHFAALFHLGRNANDGFNLYFDLDAPLPPRRLADKQVTGAGIRFFDASDALPFIQEYLDSTDKTGATPAPFRLPKGGERKHMVNVLEHLAMHWDKEPPARNYDRRQTAMTFEIRHEYPAVRNALAGDEPGELDFTGRIQKPEFWPIDNLGRGGYRAIVPKGRRGWLRLGALVAMRVEYHKAWSVAVIRRVETDELQQRKVGVRVIARKPVAAMMHSNARAGSTFKPVPGILLNTRPSRDGGVHVLLRPGTFTLKEDIFVTFGPDQQKWLLHPSRLVEAAVDFEWVRYTIALR